MMNSAPKIFVAIAAYEDPLLAWTINHAWEQASRPDCLTFGVVEQAVLTLPECKGGDYLRQVPWRESMRYLGFHPRFARGPCWARNIGFSLYGGEDFVLQIDSHMYFEKGWDDTLIEQAWAWQRATRNPRVMLSTYPNGFTLDHGIPTLSPTVEGVIVLQPKPQEHLQNEHPVMMFHGVPVPSTQPIAGCHIGAGCLFASGSLVQEVPYDPWLYFHGEEQNMAVRAWTHGYDIVHPLRMPIYHYYKQPDHQAAVHWRESDDAQRTERWWELERKAQNRLADLLYHQNIQGAYGLGERRTLAEFAQFSGIDYTQRHLRRPPAV